MSNVNFAGVPHGVRNRGVIYFAWIFFCEDLFKSDTWEKEQTRQTVALKPARVTTMYRYLRGLLYTGGHFELDLKNATMNQPNL